MMIRFVAAVGGLLLLIVIAAAAVVARAGSPADAAVLLIDTTVGRPISSDTTLVPIKVQSGDSAAIVADQLVAHSLTRNALAFRIVVRLEGLDSHLQSGTYELRPNMSTTALVSAIAQGRMAGGFLTFPEGWRIGEIADALEQSGVVNRAAFINYVEHPPSSSIAGAWPVPAGHTLEGYLFPDSYRFERNTPASVVARQMVDDFNRRVSPDLRSGVEVQGLSDYQAITLASIVEREAVVPGERPIIASVYYNRLKKGMKLQADPTVQYAVGDDSGSNSGTYWKRGITFADLASTSPFNTYQANGLPPGPICNPGLDSILAVAHPATTDYLYFVAKSDGSHAFAQTFQEQEQNVARYRT